MDVGHMFMGTWVSCRMLPEAGKSHERGSAVVLVSTMPLSVYGPNQHVPRCA